VIQMSDRELTRLRVIVDPCTCIRIKRGHYPI